MKLLLLLAPLALTATAVAAPQSDTQALAAALVRAQAPATDDVDALAAELIAKALAHRRSPVASLLIGEASLLSNQVQDLDQLRVLLAEAPGGERQHGLLLQVCAVMRWRLRRALEGPAAAGGFPTFGHADELLACGPFGDAGDDFAGVPYAPELEFPAAGSELPGRGMQARTRVSVRRADERRIDLTAPPRRGEGCHYGRLRVRAKAPVEAFLEVEHDGDFQVFVDGAEVARSERWRADACERQFIGLVMPTGVHDVVFKATKNGHAWVSLRFVDGDGQPVDDLELLPADAADVQSGEPATRSAATFATGVDVLVRAAAHADADDVVRVAAVLAALRDSRGDLAIDLADALRKAPPADPATALAFAHVLRQVPLPDELRKAEARTLEERAAAALPPAHHTARLAKASHLEEQDQREEALRLLIAHPAPGQETWSRRLDLLRQLKFPAEVVPLLREWAAACPRDPRPLVQLAHELQASAQAKKLLELRQKALALRADQVAVARAAFGNALAVCDFDAAAQLLELAEPALDGKTSTARLRLQLDLATARGDDAATGELLQQLGSHPEVTAQQLTDLAGRWTRRGDTAAAIACLERALAAGEQRTAVRAWLLRLQGTSDDAEVVSRRRDGRAAAAAFTAGAREQGASTTVLIDQCVLVIAADGTWFTECHELRRINDQAGVEAFSEHSGLGGVDEVLLVRTLATDGKEYVPSRIEGDWALQRLEPGAFVEWRYRQHGDAPGAGALPSSEFLFGSADEPAALTELVVIAPADGRGELRTRALGEHTSAATTADGRTVKVWTRTELPALAKERFLPGLFDLLPCAQFGEDEAPFATLRDHRVQLASRTRVTAPLRDAAARIVADASGDRKKADLIWAFCQREIEDGNSDRALDTLLRKKGSRFLLAVALLRAAGIEVAAMATTEARPEFGDGEQSLFASLDHLQLPAALALLAGGERLPLFVDTPRYWPLARVPATRGGTAAVVVHDDRTEAIVLPASEDAMQSLHVRGRASVKGQQLQLVATAVLGDLPGFALAERLRQQKENVQQLAARQIAQQLFSGWRIEKAALAAITPGSPLTIEATLTRAGVQRDGERFVVPLPMPLDKLVAMLGDRAERTLPWRLPVDLSSEWDVEFDPGPELRVVQCPEPVALHEPPFEFTQQVVPGGGGVRCRRLVRVVPAQAPASRFADWLRVLTAGDRAQQATIELVSRTAK